MFRFLADLPWPSYRGLLATGLVTGAALSVVSGRRRGLALPLLLDAALSAALGGLLIGRAAYAGAHWPYFRSHVAEAMAFWRGGLSAPGALIGGLAGIVVLCYLQRTDPRPVLDALAPGAAIVVICAWLGCLAAGCACGLETWPGQGLLWSLSAELPDLYGIRVPRVAVQALGAAWGGVALAATLSIGRRGRPFPLWLFLHAGGEFGLAFLRGDLSPVAVGLAAVQIADLVLALAGVLLLALPGWPRMRESASARE